MDKSLDLLVLAVGGLAIIFSSGQLWNVLRIGGLSRRGGKGPIRKEDQPIVYWTFVGWYILGLGVMLAGAVVLLSRLTS
jgi:hypothetical protein